MTGTGLRRKFSLFLVIMLIILMAAAVFFYYRFSGLLEPVAGSGTAVEKTVVIPRGAGSEKIATLLADQELIRNKTVFRLYSKYRGLDNRLKAGEYSLNTGLSTPQIIEWLAKGETLSFSFTIPEGFSLQQIAERLAEKKYIDRERFLSLAANGSFNYDFLQGLPPGPGRLEGYLFPDTYRISRETSEEQIINMMLARFAREVTPEFRTGAEKQGLSLHQAVTLASIVEREAQEDQERPKVAAVFLNRLNKGWKLESCATIQYLLGEPKARLLKKDLEIKSPYNTYINYGLPPGPISSPGSASLKAVVNPADVDFMFFVVSEDGKHIFSRTLNEHNPNKAVYLDRLKVHVE